MSDWTDVDDTDEFFDENASDTPVIRTLRAKMKKDNDTLKAMREELAALRADRRSDVVGDALKSAGLDPAVGKFYSGEPDRAAVAAWVDENKALFGAPVAQNTDQQDIATPGPLSDLTGQQQTDYQRILDAGVDGVPPSNYNDIMGALRGAQSKEDFEQVMARYS